MQVIILSQDGACQTDLLLKSIDAFFVDKSQHDFLVVGYATEKRYEANYAKLKTTVVDGRFFDWNHCKKHEHTLFLRESLLFQDYFSVDCDELYRLKTDDNIMAVSLRHSPAMNDKALLKHREWMWCGVEGLWGDCMSLYGHIYRTRQIIPYLSKFQFKQPNELEQMIKQEPLNIPKLICFDKAKVINLLTDNTRYLDDMFTAGRELVFQKVHSNIFNIDMDFSNYQ